MLKGPSSASSIGEFLFHSVKGLLIFPQSVKAPAECAPGVPTLYCGRGVEWKTGRGVGQGAGRYAETFFSCVLYHYDMLGNSI